jgi:hypothetical protein
VDASHSSAPPLRCHLRAGGDPVSSCLHSQTLASHGSPAFAEDDRVVSADKICTACCRHWQPLPCLFLPPSPNPLPQVEGAYSLAPLHKTRPITQKMRGVPPIQKKWRWDTSNCPQTLVTLLLNNLMAGGMNATPCYTPTLCPCHDQFARPPTRRRGA